MSDRDILWGAALETASVHHVEPIPQDGGVSGRLFDGRRCDDRKRIVPSAWAVVPPAAVP